MRARILTCKNHPHLRWSCKEIAWTEGYGYNGSRSLFFMGVPSPRGMFSDRSGLDCDDHDQHGDPVFECDCGSGDLLLAPEDANVKP